MKGGETMNKQYIQPELEIYPITALTVLCSSNEENVNMENSGSENPWTGGRAPRRTPAF